MISPYPLWMAAATNYLCCDQGCDDNEYSMSRASSTGQSRVLRHMVGIFALILAHLLPWMYSNSIQVTFK